MNENGMNRTEWHDGQGSVVETNDPIALAENADGKWHRVKEFNKTEMTVHGKTITTGVQYFNGYEMHMHAEAKATKAESAVIWLSLPVGILIGFLVSKAKNLMIGIYAGMFIFLCVFIGICFKALLREDPEKNKKIVIIGSCITLGVLIFIGIVMVIISRAIGL